MPLLTTPEEGLILILLFHAGRDRQDGDCSSPGPAATAAERPDVFQPQVQEVQTLLGSALAHRTREGKERPISPAFEA